MAISFNKPDSGPMAKIPKLTTPIPKFIKIGDKVEETHKIIVHRFKLSDVDDPDLYAGQPLYEWTQSEQGKWIMEHSLETPFWHRHIEPTTYGYQYAITATLLGKDYTFWQLKWASSVDN